VHLKSSSSSTLSSSSLDNNTNHQPFTIMEPPILPKSFTSRTSTQASTAPSAIGVRVSIQAPKTSTLTSPFSLKARHICAHALSTPSNYTKMTSTQSSSATREYQ
jgi:hypothetical protein